MKNSTNEQTIQILLNIETDDGQLLLFQQEDGTLAFSHMNDDDLVPATPEEADQLTQTFNQLQEDFYIHDGQLYTRQMHAAGMDFCTGTDESILYPFDPASGLPLAVDEAGLKFAKSILLTGLAENHEFLQTCKPEKADALPAPAILETPSFSAAPGLHGQIVFVGNLPLEEMHRQFLDWEEQEYKKAKTFTLASLPHCSQ